jgi:hypothetical protein
MALPRLCLVSMQGFPIAVGHANVCSRGPFSKLLTLLPRPSDAALSHMPLLLLCLVQLLHPDLTETLKPGLCLLQGFSPQWDLRTVCSRGPFSKCAPLSQIETIQQTL